MMFPDVSTTVWLRLIHVPKCRSLIWVGRWTKLSATITSGGIKLVSWIKVVLREMDMCAIKTWVKSRDGHQPIDSLGWMTIPHIHHVLTIEPVKCWWPNKGMR